MGKEWIRLKEVGQLYLEKVLVTFDIPILFVCVDYENRKYLCLNIDDESGKSVIVATDNKHLIDMLKNKISMDSVFRNAINGKAIIVDYDSENDKIITLTKDAKKISGDMLPEKDAYFEFTNKSIEEYISYLDKQLIRIDIECFSEKKSIIVQQCGYFASFVAGETNAHCCGRVMLTETMKKCSYNIIDKNKMIA